MRRPHLTAFAVPLSLALGLVAPVGTGCDDGGEGGGACSSDLDAEGCFDVACYTEGPARSFQADVLPVFELSCALAASCHGTKMGPAAQPYLGEVNPETTPSDIAFILQEIVGVGAQAASMPIVDPGKPENSFLMHKMDGSLSCSSLTCSGSCGTPMPQGSDILPRETRDVVRDWIKQGAQNN